MALHLRHFTLTPLSTPLTQHTLRRLTPPTLSASRHRRYSLSVMASAARKVLIPVANGTEPMEAVVTIDILRRAGADVTVASVENQLRVDACHGVKFVADALISDVSDTVFDLISLPGGMPGAATLKDSATLESIVKKHVSDGRTYAAICAAPAVALGSWGLLKGLKATCYPSFMEQLSSSAVAVESRVQQDGNVVTSRGPGTAMEFSLALVEKLFGKDKADEVSGPLVMRSEHKDEFIMAELNPLPWTVGSSPKILVPVANGTEEMEAVMIIDVLRRAKAEVVVASLEDTLEILASRKVKLVADVLLDEAIKLSYDLIVLPGGLGGAEAFAKSEKLVNLLKKQRESDKFYGAICASPALVLEPHGLLKAFSAFSITDIMSWFTCFYAKQPLSPQGQVDIEEEVSTVQSIKLYSYKELQVATEDFSPANKIGQGGFGSVYKGRLNDGIFVAVKVLSAESSQGVREFLTELTVISDVKHKNLVKLYGCCVEKDHRILVYGYLENNSLAQTLLGGGHSSIQFSWKTRTKICIGVARGLAYLHEEVEPYIVHRDIKASNILLDKDFTPKISDFGLAKLFPSHLTHISTRIAGTEGYLAPEYAVRGQLTKKADIYSFGVLLLEIVCGRCNQNRRLPVKEQFLLDRAWELYRNGKLVELVDTALEEEFDTDEACRYLKIGLLCAQNVPKNRPNMYSIVKMLRGEMDINEKNISSPGLMSELTDLKSHSTATSDRSSIVLQTQDDSSSGNNTTMSYATMTFTSIDDRSS